MYLPKASLALLALSDLAACYSIASLGANFAVGEYTGSLVGRATSAVATRAGSKTRRQLTFTPDGGIQAGGAGGITLGGNGANQQPGAAASGNGAGNGVLTVGGITLGGKKNGTAAGNAPAAEPQRPGTVAPAEGQRPGAEVLAQVQAPGAVAPVEGQRPGAEAPAQGQAPGAVAPAEGAQAGNGGEITAVTESEQFKDNAGITVDPTRGVTNLGGNLGITKGSDGSQSVGGKSGINIGASPAKVAAAAADNEDGEGEAEGRDGGDQPTIGENGEGGTGADEGEDEEA